MPNLVDLLIHTNSQYPGLSSLPLHPLVRGLSYSLMMKGLPFTVAGQRQNFIGLPCKEDIRQEYLHLIVCIKLNDAKAALASLLVICILIEVH